MKKVIIISMLLASIASHVRAQLVVTDPAHIATSIANSANLIVQNSSTVTHMIKNWQEVKKIHDQSKEYYDGLKSVNHVVKDARKVRDAFLLVGEIGDIYMENYQKMLSDPNFRYQELTAISGVYTILLQDAADILLEMKDVVNANGLSMTDYERMSIIDNVYERLRKHRNLVSYFTRKTLSVSYDRAVKSSETQRFLDLYGTVNEKYW